MHALADAGCTVAEIVAVTGHTLENATKILKRYDFPDREIAEAAIVKLMEKRPPTRKVERGIEVTVESDAAGSGKLLAFPKR